MTSGKFSPASAITPEVLDWGQLSWISHPPSTGASQLTVIEVELAPGKGHDFHKHPDQEEVIYIIAGKVEQWIGEEMQMLQAGDSAFLPKDMVHASFNAGDANAKIIAILGPCVGDGGYELVEVAHLAPWNNLR